MDWVTGMLAALCVVAWAWTIAEIRRNPPPEGPLDTFRG